LSIFGRGSINIAGIARQIAFVLELGKFVTTDDEALCVLSVKDIPWCVYGTSLPFLVSYLCIPTI
jgi:hypothetical protein